jgi:uncharacterized protein
MDMRDNQGFSNAQPVGGNETAPIPANATVSLAPGGAVAPVVQPSASAAPTSANVHHIGFVMEIAGSGSQISLDAARLNELMQHSDPSIAMAGQVGSQIKIRIGGTWLLASIRTQKLHSRDQGVIVAAVDFLGEGDEERLTGAV